LGTLIVAFLSSLMMEEPGVMMDERTMYRSRTAWAICDFSPTQNVGLDADIIRLLL
jgi:hypothetical protein